MTTRFKKRKPRILIAGLGNLLLQDDGIGIHAVRELQKDPPPGVLVVDIGTAVLTALHLYEWAERVLVIDAMEAGGAPGTMYLCRDRDVADPAIQASLHELSLLAALRFVSPQKRPEVIVLGVEPETIDYGLHLSPVLESSLPRLTKTVRDLVIGWLSK